MADEPVRGFLPPRAEGGATPVPPARAPEAVRPQPQAAAPPQASFVQPAGETNGNAVAALVLGISGLALTVLFAGWLFFVAIPCSIMAWIFGVQGKRKVDRGEVATQRGLAKAGHILGIVGVVLAVLAIIFWVVLFFGMGIELEDLENELGRPASAMWQR